jgi:flagellar basal-body rod protein FlgB
MPDVRHRAEPKDFVARHETFFLLVGCQRYRVARDVTVFLNRVTLFLHPLQLLHLGWHRDCRRDMTVSPLCAVKVARTSQRALSRPAKPHVAALRPTEHSFRNSAMFVSLVQSTTIPLVEQVVHFTKSRHNVLAGNIANCSTPGYRSLDLSVEDFQYRLREAVAAQQQLAMRLPGETDLQPSPRMADAAKESPTLLRPEGDGVSMEREVTEMVKNKGQHNLALSIMVSQFRLLQSAVSERV